MRFIVLAAALLGAAVPATALELSLPVACTIGTDCAVQHYFDRDSGGDALDYMCGHQTYDGHDGVDIRAPDLRAMAAGVDVIAAAPGTVRATRDGMADVSIAEAGAESVANVECGNGVMIDHDGGWATQYCHLKEGSIAVRRGDRVDIGTVLGEIGLSGMTEFPHVHFSVYRDDVEIDPFALERATAGAACDLAGDSATGIWSPEAAAALAYRPAFVLNAGFTGGPLEMEDIESGAVAGLAPTATSPALVFFGRAIGIEAGDVQRIVITAPDGALFAENEVEPVDRPKAQYFAFTGRKLRTEAWPSGTWTGRYAVIRDGEEIAFREVTFAMPE